MSSATSISTLTLVLVLAGFGSGCAGYRLGPTNNVSAGARSVQVNPFQNRTLEPRLSQAVVQALRKRFQEDGTFRLATRGEGDIILSGTITEFDRLGVTFNPNDVLTVRDYVVTMQAHVVAVDRRTGETLLDQSVSGRTTVRSGPNQPNSERQAVPILAQDMAQRAVSLLADGTW